MFAGFSQDRTADNTTQTMTGLLSDWCGVVKTITFDNGLEFVGHRQVKEALNIDTFFADPYSSWQRGTNERHNGLIRRFFPKGTDFCDITDQDLTQVVGFWNNYPRKILDYHTPKEIWDDKIAKLTKQKEPAMPVSVLLKP